MLCLTLQTFGPDPSVLPADVVAFVDLSPPTEREAAQDPTAALKVGEHVRS